MYATWCTAAFWEQVQHRTFKYVVVTACSVRVVHWLSVKHCLTGMCTAVLQPVDTHPGYYCS